MLGESVVAGIEEKRVIPGLVKMGRQGKHQGGVPTPTMNDDDCWTATFAGDEPTVKPGAVDASQPDLFFGQAEIGRGLLIRSPWWGEQTSDDSRKSREETGHEKS
jgi:hypothetical protein